VTLDARSRGYVVSPQDAWIAATALDLAAPLVTHNARHFEGVFGLKIHTAYSAPARGE
jgi:predicted nucleic acid-binding protein